MHAQRRVVARMDQQMFPVRRLLGHRAAPVADPLTVHMTGAQLHALNLIPSLGHAQLHALNRIPKKMTPYSTSTHRIHQIIWAADASAAPPE
jgi:hypothetical protein